MTKFLEEAIDNLWPKDEPAPRPPSTAGIGASPGFRPPSSKWELRAEETTRVAREMTGADTEKRHADTSRLRRARLEREAAEKALAALAPAKKKRKG